MKISGINNFEKLRDGGSLIVSFQSDDSCEYWLMFPLKDFDTKDSTYLEPVLINRKTGIETDVSRDSAKQWLLTLEYYFTKRRELPTVSKQSETEIFNQMLTLCKVD